MKPALTLVALLVLPTLSFTQDLRLRQEAVQLLERANAASTAPKLPNLERVDTFRVLDSPSGPQEGSFSRVVIQGTGRREETTFGDYHVVNVWTRERLATAGAKGLVPPAVIEVIRLTPFYHVSFDEADVIQAITDRKVGDRALRCVDFDTVTGYKTQNNELCVDGANGTMVSLHVGNEFIEYSDFFPFAGALMPGKISYSFLGLPRLEISQTMSVLTEVTPNVLAAPPNALVLQACITFRRAFGESMPQPKPGNGGGDFDVLVRGVIGTDGKVHDAVVQSSERSDLDAEAVNVMQQWVFTPARCDGRPVFTEASFTLHFQAR